MNNITYKLLQRKFKRIAAALFKKQNKTCTIDNNAINYKSNGTNAWLRSHDEPRDLFMSKLGQMAISNKQIKLFYRYERISTLSDRDDSEPQAIF
jgi:hypothetical protein